MVNGFVGTIQLKGDSSLFKQIHLLQAHSEMEFLDINLTKDSSLLLHGIHSLSIGGFFKKT